LPLGVENLFPTEGGGAGVFPYPAAGWSLSG
jgi:hypothetical protein